MAKVTVVVGEVFGEPCLLSALAGSEEAIFLSSNKRKEDLTPEERSRKVVLTFMGCLILDKIRLPSYCFEFEKDWNEADEQEERCMLTDGKGHDI